MKTYIKDNLKTILSVTIMLFCTVALIVTNEIRAQMLPTSSDTLNVIYYEIENEVCNYTGNAIENEIHRIIFADENDNRIVMYRNDFKIINYFNNIEVGYADIEIEITGYQGTIVIEDAFAIQPATVTNLQITNATQNHIDLTWDKVPGVDGYLLYKSKDNGENYMPIKEAKSGKALIYTDTDVALNEVYSYYVRAYKKLDTEVVFGNPSEILKIYTPLDNPVITDVKNAAYNTLQVEWAIVNGAAGYQVYRSDKQDGEYTLLADITNGLVMSYSDATCECGTVYYYYIKVSQKTDTETVYGAASAVASGKTTPNKTDLSGVTSDDDTKITLNWKKTSGAQGYEVYKNNQLVATIENADTLTWEEAGLPKETEVSYKVRAYCIVDGQKLFGLFSSTYEKEITIIFNYGDTSPEMQVLLQYVGRPYKFGGTSPTNGWDCSAFVQYAYKKHFGASLPRTAAEQARYGTEVSKNDRSSWKPGDLIFYKEKNGKGPIGHVAIYLGNGQIIHALSEKQDTRINNVDEYETWDENKMYCVKRLFQ